MTYNINTTKGTTNQNSWEYWTLNPPNNNILILNNSLTFDDNPGIITLKNGSSFDCNGYSLKFLNINNGIPIFNLEGGIISNINIDTNGILNINNLLTNNTNIINANTLIDGNLFIEKDLNIQSNISNNLIITSNAKSISETTGTLVVYGGIGINSNLNIGGNINFNGQLLKNNSIYISPPWITSNSNIYYTNGNVGIGTITPNTTLDVAGTTRISGITKLTNTTDSSIPNEGALIIEGGATIYKDLNIMGNVNIGKNLIVSNQAKFEGEVNALNNLNVSKQMNISGITKIMNQTNNNTITGNNGALVINGGVGINGNTTVGGFMRVRNNVMVGNASLILSENSIGGTNNIAINSNVIFNKQIKTITSTGDINIDTTKPLSVLDKQQGTVLWAANISGSGEDIGYSICSDNLGGIYVTGYFGNNPVTFYHANGIVGNTKINSSSINCFVAKYNNIGSVQWAANISGGSEDIGYSICSDNSGGIYITGYFFSNPVNFYHANGVVGTTKINSGSNDCFIAKYNNSGTVQWAANISGIGSEIGNSICSDNLGGIYITGSFSNTINFYHANGVVGATKINSGGSDCFIVKYNNSGTVQWAANIAGISNEIGNSICSDNLGGIYVTGSFSSGSVTFYHANGVVGTTKTNLSNTDCFIAKYNNSGTVQWAATIGGSSNEIGYSICSDNLGGIYVTGEFTSSTITFYNANGSIGTIKTRLLNIDCFIAKYNISGTVQWATHITGFGQEIGYEICSDNSGGIYVTGLFSSTVTFYHANGVVGDAKINSGSNDCFIAKYNNSGTVRWVANIAGSSGDVGSSICSDNLGGIYITGRFFSNPVNFYHANGVVGNTKINSGSDDCFIACYQDSYFLPNLAPNDDGTTLKTVNISGGITNIINSNTQTIIQPNKYVEYLWYNNKWFTI